MYDKRKIVISDNFKQMMNLMELMYIIESDDSYINRIMLGFEEKCKSFIEYYNTGNMCYLVNRDVNGFFEYVDYLANILKEKGVDISEDMRKVMYFNEYVTNRGLLDESLVYYLEIIFNKPEAEIKLLSEILDFKKTCEYDKEKKLKRTFNK